MRRNASILSSKERRRLNELIESCKGSDLALRARIVLASEDRTQRAVSQELGVAQQTVAKWRRRYFAEGEAGLRDRARPGKPRRFPAEVVEALIRETMAKPAPLEERWTVRKVAQEIGLSPATVGRAWRHALAREREVGPNRRSGRTTRESAR